MTSLDKSVFPGDLVVYREILSYNYQTGDLVGDRDCVGIVISVYDVPVIKQSRRGRKTYTGYMTTYCDVLFATPVFYANNWERLTSSYHKMICPERLKKVL